MPAPIPPPPPQPTLDETRDAVRLLRWICLAALALFLLEAHTVHLRGFFVEYGRDNTASWMLWKASRLREGELRGHEGGRLVWLVGSSILRESFDEEVANAALESAQSPYRVVKFGQNRGASGLSAGLLERLPVREGDLVLHTVGMENFLEGWIDRTGLPWWRITMLVPPERWWQVSEWTPQEKLENALSLPAPFWEYREEAMTGWLRWIEAPWQGVPKKRRTHYTLEFLEGEHRATFDPAAEADLESAWRLDPEDIDLSERQFNVMGLAWMRERCEAVGARLVLADVPPRQQYVQQFMAPEVQKSWEAWRDAQAGLLKFPQLPEDDYYDMKHPNFRGRARLTGELVSWLLGQGDG